MKKERYKLYALLPTQENLQIAERERFYMVCPDHILIYRRPWRKKPKEAVEVGENIRTSEQESDWIRTCNLCIMREFSLRHEESAAAGMESFLEKFEKELAAEQEKLAVAAGT